MIETLRFGGTPLAPRQIALIVNLVQRFGRLSRFELAQTICELLDWRRPNGQLKAIECRALLETLEARGLIVLPALKVGRPKGAATKVPLTLHPNPAAVTGSLLALRPIRLVRVLSHDERALWRTLIERHHYLGHRTPFGAHLRYLIQAGDSTPLGCLQFSSPAWRLRARDQWIGWDEATRQKSLQRIIGNSRFLLLPDVHIKNLASHVLALAVRTVTRDWEAAYGLRPLLIETFVDSARFTGTCYLAANWIDVGLTQGRGRDDRDHQRHGASPKRILLYPLVPDARTLLSQAV